MHTESCQSPGKIVLYLSIVMYHIANILNIAVCRQFPHKKNILSEVGFEPTPTEVDCDLNAAP